MKTLLRIALPLMAFAMFAPAQSPDSEKNAVQYTCEPGLPFQGIAQCTFVTVPAGKRLVIEHASARCYTASLNEFLNRMQIQTTLNGLIGRHYLQQTRLVQPNENYYVASQSMKAYADGGTEVKAGTSTYGYNSASCSFTISGYLYPMGH